MRSLFVAVRANQVGVGQQQLGFKARESASERRAEGGFEDYSAGARRRRARHAT
ncbi:MAG: hypothetical protein JO248_10090 [Acidimicrobiia bacterium]|nr:hypothetical protein [Acidimicrobiia bacterium]